MIMTFRSIRLLHCCYIAVTLLVSFSFPRCKGREGGREREREGERAGGREREKKNRKKTALGTL